jgi:hypothetical protein
MSTGNPSMGSRAQKVSDGLSCTIMMSAKIAPKMVLTKYMMAGPVAMRTACTSLASRAMRSPVRHATVPGGVEREQSLEDIAPQVGLDATTDAVEQFAHAEPEGAGDRAVISITAPRRHSSAPSFTTAKRVDAVAQEAGDGVGGGGRQDDAQQSEQDRAAVRAEVGEDSPQGDPRGHRTHGRCTIASGDAGATGHPVAAPRAQLQREENHSMRQYTRTQRTLAVTGTLAATLLAACGGSSGRRGARFRRVVGTRSRARRAGLDATGAAGRAGRDASRAGSGESDARAEHAAGGDARAGAASASDHAASHDAASASDGDCLTRTVTGAGAGTGGSTRRGDQRGFGHALRDQHACVHGRDQRG